MSDLLILHGCSEEDELYFLDYELSAELNGSEKVIFDCIRTHGRVVHHSELVRAFLASDLKIPSLHARLNNSPLFAKVDTALYHLRGEAYDEADVERAREAANRVPIDLIIDYHIDGTLDVSVNLAPMTIASGIFVCASDSFPNLRGEWKLSINGASFGTMEATDTEFKRLAKAFEHLGLSGGERVLFTFDTEARSVSLARSGGGD